MVRSNRCECSYLTPLFLLITLNLFMQSKSLLIAIAALALTATGVQAYGGSKLLTRAGLTEDQQSALEEAHTLRQEGDFVAARDTLVEAGIDEDVLRSLRDSMHESRAAVHAALEDGDYEAFKDAIIDTPLADSITTEEEFELFREAHELRRAGDREGADEIFNELGIETPTHRPYMMGRHGHGPHMMFEEFTDEQREALRVARQSNDRETIKAILEEAGVERRGGF